MDIFIINLKKSLARRNRMKEVMHKAGLEYSIFEAVDGYSLSKEELENNIKVHHQYHRSFTPGEVGCFLSHYFIFKKIVAENISYALVLEDDVRVSPRLPALLNKIEPTIKQGDVICLYASVPEPSLFFKSKQIDDNYFYIKPYLGELVVGAVAYIITKEAAQKMVENIYPMDNVIDDWRSWVQRKLISDFKIVFPHPVDLADVYSDIDEPFGNLKLKVKKFILNNKVPFISDLILKKRRERRFTDRRNKLFIDDKNPESLFY